MAPTTSTHAAVPGYPTAARTLRRSESDRWVAIAAVHDLRNNPHVASALYNIGFVYRCLGLYRVAIDLQQQARALWEAIDKKRYEVVTAQALNELGRCHAAIGNTKLALGFHDQALQIRTRLATEGVLGWEAAATSWRRLAMVYVSEGHLYDAERLCVHAEQVGGGPGSAHRAGRCTPAPSSSVGHSQHSFGRVWHAQGLYHKARVSYDKALATFTAIHGTNYHRDVAKARTSLAWLHIDARVDEVRDWPPGSMDAALGLLNMSIGMYRRMYGGIDHRDLAHALHGLSCVYVLMDRQPEAVELHNTALAMYAGVFGTSGHPSIQDARASFERAKQAHARGSS